MLDVMRHQPLYIIIFCPRTMVTWHDGSSGRNLFLENYRISASLFVLRGSNIKLFFAIYLFYFSDILRHDRNLIRHHTRALLMTTRLSHTGSGRPHGTLLTRLQIMTIHLTSGTLPPNVLSSFSHRLWSHMCTLLPNPRSSLRSSARTLGQVYIKPYINGSLADVKYNYDHVYVSFAVSLTLQYPICYGGWSQIEHHGSMQLSHPEH